MASKHSITNPTVEMSADLREVIDLFRDQAWPEDTAAIETEALALLTTHGFDGAAECRHQYGTRRGRVDLIVTRAGAPIAIEIDNKSPRERTIAKLRAFKGERLLVLKAGKSARPPQLRGIHRVISVAVKSVDKHPPNAETSVCLPEN